MHQIFLFNSIFSGAVILNALQFNLLNHTSLQIIFYFFLFKIIHIDNYVNIHFLLYIDGLPLIYQKEIDFVHQ